MTPWQITPFISFFWLYSFCDIRSWFHDLGCDHVIATWELCPFWILKYSKTVNSKRRTMLNAYFHFIFLICIFIMMLCFTNVRNAQASFCIFRSFVKLIFLFPNTLLCVLDCYLVTYNYRAVAARTKLLVLQILCVRRISRYGVIHLLSRE